MPKSDPHLSHLSHPSNENVFERLHKGLNGLATDIPSASQNPYWKTFVVQHLEFRDLAFENGWMDYASQFPMVEECLESVLKELDTFARIALLDPCLQIEVVSGNPDVPVKAPGAPTWAFPVRQQEWIKEFVEVRPATQVLLLLFKLDIQLLSKEEVLADLRHELGHAFLYLRDPGATEDCFAADEEWKRCTQVDNLMVRLPIGPLNAGE